MILCNIHEWWSGLVKFRLLIHTFDFYLSQMTSPEFLHKIINDRMDFFYTLIEYHFEFNFDLIFSLWKFCYFAPSRSLSRYLSFFPSQSTHISGQIYGSKYIWFE